MAGQATTNCNKCFIEYDSYSEWTRQVNRSDVDTST